MKNKYKVYEKNEDSQCLKIKYEKPGEDIRILFRDTVKNFIKNSNNMFNGGWAIHNALIKINPKFALYNEQSICDTNDIDLFGYTPVESMIQLGNILSKKIAKKDMEFVISPGLHVNQYTLIVSYLGIKIIDFIYISKRIYNFLDKEKNSDGFNFIDSKIEIMRQYYMITNVFLLGPEKNINKIFDRIYMLEKHILIPYFSKLGIWDLRKNLLNNIYVSNNNIIDVYKNIKQFIKSNKYICMVGLKAYMKIFKQFESSGSYSSNKNVMLYNEYVIHDAEFNTSVEALFNHLKKTTFSDDITIEFHDAFIGVIGPLYNGWVDIYVDKYLLCSIYSLATPVHIYKNNITSYFFNMAHCLWRELYFRFIKNEEMHFLYTKLIAKFLKMSIKAQKLDFFKYKITENEVVGHFPCRNFYQVSNKLRAKQQYYFKINIPENKLRPNKPINDYFYRDFEGLLLLKIKLNKLYKMYRLNYLYRRGDSKAFK